MKITRILTYNIDENYIRNFYDEDWWDDKSAPDENDYNSFIDSIRADGYDNEEIIHQQGDKERIMQIWQEECDKYHKGQDPETKKEQLRNQLQNCKDVIEIYKNMIAQLEELLKDA